MAPAKSGNFVGLFRHALGCQLQIGYRFPHGFPQPLFRELGDEKLLTMEAKAIQCAPTTPRSPVGTCWPAIGRQTIPANPIWG